MDAFNCSSTIYKKTILRLLHDICTDIKNRLDLIVWVYFWISVRLSYVSVPSLIPYSVNYSSSGKS